jgi:hypothetical protein
MITQLQKIEQSRGAYDVGHMLDRCRDARLVFREPTENLFILRITHITAVVTSPLRPFFLI